MEARQSFETSGETHTTTQRHIPEETSTHARPLWEPNLAVFKPDIADLMNVDITDTACW